MAGAHRRSFPGTAVDDGAGGIRLPPQVFAMSIRLRLLGRIRSRVRARVQLLV